MKPRESPKENSSGVLRLFVYGTLKRGYWNHDPFCRGVLAIQEAQVRGRLFEGPGFPVLEVPDEDILAHGTGDPLADMGIQGRACPGSGVPDRSPKAPQWVPGAPCTGSCSPSTIHNPACLPSTGWRASVQAVPACTAVCWCPPRSTESGNSPGSTRSRRPASNGAGSYPAAGRSNTLTVRSKTQTLSC